MITIFVTLIVVFGMLAAFWLGYKAGAKEPLKLQSYPEFVDLEEEVEKEKPIEAYFSEDEE